MLKNSILIIFTVLILTTNIKAEEKNYQPIFNDGLASSLIKTVIYDDANDYLYINGIELYPSSFENVKYYSLTINDILFNFVYSNEDKKITIKYNKPIEIKVDTKIGIYSLNNKTFLHVMDVDGSRDYQGIESIGRIDFNPIININNKTFNLNVYLDKTNNRLIFEDQNFNFNVSVKEEKTIDVLLSGEIKNNKIYAINNPMNLKDAIEGQIDDETIDEYLSNININLFNNTYSLTKEITLKKLMNKWNKITNNEYEKETIQTACVNKEAMCEVFEKTAYLINDYNYKEVEEDNLNLVDGTKDTPLNKRVYTTEDQISYTPVVGENLEVYKQERNKTIEYNNWSEYKEEACEDSDEKKCRYKEFYTKYTYPYIKSEPQYTDWIRANYLLDDPVETTETQYTMGPYLNCTKYEEKEIEVNEYTCLARDETVHRVLIQCEGDVYYQKYCMSAKPVNLKKEYNLEPLDEKDRDWCSKCVVKRTQSVLKDSEGNEYSNFNVDGKTTKIYLPKGNCINYTKETHTETIRGACEVMEYKYDLYLRDYLGDIDYYEETPIIQTDLESCVEKTSKLEGKITCTKKIKTSYSNPDIRYSEWKDVEDFSNQENIEKRYRYKEFKTSGIKLTNKTIKEGEYNITEANNIINLLAEEKTKLNQLNETNQYALIEEYKKRNTFEINKQNNIYLLENKKIFAPVIHVVENNINQFETIQFPIYTGEKTIGTSSFYTTEEVEEVLFLPITKESEKKVVFFNEKDATKIEEAENWKEQKELLQNIKETDVEDSKFEITINKEQLKQLNEWVSKKENRDKRNCEFIREFSNIVTKPKNFSDLLVKTSGCEF